MRAGRRFKRGRSGGARFGLQKTGQDGLIDFQMMSADPAPPQRGDNTWIVQISAMDSAPTLGNVQMRMVWLEKEGG